MRYSKGFSLVELLVVVAIILVIAAIAIPNLMRSKMQSAEASAIATLRSLNTAELTFASTYNSGFSDTLRRLGNPSSGQADINNADLLDPILSANSVGNTGATGFVKGGYSFVYAPLGTGFGFYRQYNINSDPQVRGSTGQRSFYTNHSTNIHANQNATASASDPML